MDLRGGDPESTRSACVKLRDLAVAAEGPGAPFTATRRGQQLLRLIHIVVQNVGLEDKVGALTALRLLKADDTLLQKLLKEGILPPLLAIIARDAEDADGDWLDADVTVSGVSESPGRFFAPRPPPPPRAPSRPSPARETRSPRFCAAARWRCSATGCVAQKASSRTLR
jgi:hypothetical protein